MESKFEFLLPAFLEAMNEIGQYGHEKYGTASFQFRRLLGDSSRGDMERTQAESIAVHAKAHFDEYLKGNPHDKFGTQIHQLAAIAFNAMMEAYFAGLTK